GASSPTATFKWLGMVLLALLVVIAAPGLLICLLVVYGLVPVFWGVAWLCAAGTLTGAGIGWRTRNGWRRVWSYWYPASVLVTATARLVLIAVQQARWPAGSVHLITLISYGTDATEIPTGIVLAVALIQQVIRWSRRPSMR
ncbi:MAG: hypothetical protein ACRDNF_18965, partial [Streptosporangiaceae bacterium]